MEIIVGKRILSANAETAADNRRKLRAEGVLAVNLLGSPGAGKTTLLEALIPHIRGRLTAAVIEGDLATARDAERIEATGLSAIQINTGGGCHLDAGMVASAFDSLDFGALDLLLIENVGNLVCTAGFDLGEHLRVVVLSVTEGDDKVEKYPPMFRSANCLVLNKIDLLPHTNFDVERTTREARILSRSVEVMGVSATSGEGVETFARWLIEQRRNWIAGKDHAKQ
ncbi:hydrogenase nickel incorporation protein HypB [Candidatus Hydrogenedentota bacterium]